MIVRERERERKRGDLNHLSVHQRIRSAIRDSQQPTSPIGFLLLKLPPPPCAVVLVYTVYIYIYNDIYIYTHTHRHIPSYTFYHIPQLRSKVDWKSRYAVSGSHEPWLLWPTHSHSVRLSFIDFHSEDCTLRIWDLDHGICVLVSEIGFV